MTTIDMPKLMREVELPAARARIAELEVVIRDLIAWRDAKWSPTGINVVGLGDVSDAALDAARDTSNHVWCCARKSVQQ